MLHPITMLGDAYHQYGDRPFGIRLPDRLHHFYAVGQTGAGKSTLIANLAMQDAAQGIGFCLIDPHGDLASGLSARLTVSHHYWDVADHTCPYGYNPLARVPASLRPLVTSALIETLKKQWADSWGARMEHLLRYAVLALLDQRIADLRDIVRLYTDKEFRRGIVARLHDEQVRTFWTQEFPNMNYMNAVDGVAPIANKLGAFLAHPVIRRAICEPAQPLRFRQIMDQGEIVIVNLAKGRIGSDMANVLGGLIVSSTMNAAFSRHSVPPDQRRPFFLLVDEFHSFTTGALANLLPESRKYGLSLALAGQSLSQSSPDVTAAVLGNVGTIIAFRLGIYDASTMARQLGLEHERHLLTLPNYRAFAQLMVNGTKTETFSMVTSPSPTTPSAEQAFEAS
jgi:hypothetical protein